MLRAVNRVVLGVAGAVLLCAGGAALAAGLGADVPSWWPWDGRRDVLLSTADRERWRDEGWWWPTVIAVLAVVVVLALWLLLAQLHRGRLADLRVDSGDDEGALLRGRALEEVLAAEAGALAGVSRARVRLTGRPRGPRARIGLLLEPYASPRRTLEGLAAGAVEHARAAAGLGELPAEARLRAVRHGARRVG
ncbi:alkaline shock response membrane anchor protein AmaP [Streptomyces yaizuensis]|uniref:Alkaline shock response membrane anchor protein AmaP n=1 Tax=Streptomyces yaizuensis TaxID=2989713 RepID=A0ABQ5P8V0_9ACTN|nr:alkaline shock response membrane anchor protein AmaP [Streptomyces sp. YSPA8]GLF98691.1 alkaline shock response membrane anchor protein AmaP [Streptomyces sp. YSPA8]